MAKDHFIRCDHWTLAFDRTAREMAEDTIEEYRHLVNALCTVFLTHWPKETYWVGCKDASVQTLERLFHTTSKNPDSKYGEWFDKRFNRFPSYLRRAATMAALGAVSSFMTRYWAWQGGNRRKCSARPPSWGKFQGFPVLYSAKGGAGAMIRWEGSTAYAKLYSKKTKAWTWHPLRIVSQGKRHNYAQEILSPTLMVKRGKMSLTVPMEMVAPKTLPTSGENPEVVCAVDVGMNSYATCSIIDENGTVIARRFISPQAAHIARRDLCFVKIQQSAKKTIGGVVCVSPNGEKTSTAGKLSKGFCSHTYRRLRNLNTEIARDVSRAIIAFSREFGASTIVFENLKGFRPKGGAKRSALRQKFHTWLHRKLVDQVQSTTQEKGMRVFFVSPRGTSAWAYDGSGKVSRNKENASLCVFPSGKQYNCDLSASYNIGARYFCRKKKASPSPVRNARGCATGKSPRSQQRMPGVLLSSLWKGSHETPSEAYARK